MASMLAIFGFCRTQILIVRMCDLENSSVTNYSLELNILLYVCKRPPKPKDMKLISILWKNDKRCKLISLLTTRANVFCQPDAPKLPANCICKSIKTLQ